MTEGAPAAVHSAPELFAVECTTCKARLKVRSLAAIGQILACPKCHSMVMVTPPADWQPAGAAPPVVAEGLSEAATAPAASSAMMKLALFVIPAAALCAAGVFIVWRQLPERESSPVALAPDVTSVQPSDDVPVAPTATTAPSDAAPATSAVLAPVATDTEASAADDGAVREAHAATPVDPTDEPTTDAPAVAASIEEPPAPAAAPPSVEPAAPPQPMPFDAAESASTADDLLRRLKTRVAAIDEPRISLAAVAELLGGLSACPIELDDVSLAALGVSDESLTAVKLEDGTIEAALQAALDPLALRFEPRGKAIVIYAPVE